MGCLFDAKGNGRKLKFLKVIDEQSRLCLAIQVGRRCSANNVVADLEELTCLYPAPAFIRSDNGPEFIAQALRNWCEASRTTSTSDIETGSPWEKGFAVSINGQFREKCLQRSLTPRLLRCRSWPFVGIVCTNRIVHIRPSRWVGPWRQINRQLRHDNKQPLSYGLDRQRGARRREEAECYKEEEARNLYCLGKEDRLMCRTHSI